MDAVVLYVNCDDKEWQKEYYKCFNLPFKPNRFRDWGTLKYWFRGLANNAPYINKVFLVVSSESQIPDWINRSEVNIVLHKDIIPSQYLPLFNSCSIEIFIPFIKDLSEEFIYLNDDIILINPCSQETFFENGISHVFLRERDINEVSDHNIYRHHCLNSTNLARRALDIPESNMYMFPPHWASTMYKSYCLKLFKEMESDILGQISKLRTKHNVNQYMYLVYQYLSGVSMSGNVSRLYLEFKKYELNEVTDKIRSTDKKILCLNDSGVTESNYEHYKSEVLKAFNYRFPIKCKYEI